jgi:hypothetical protein
MVCSEGKLTCTGKDARGQPLRWAWEFAGGSRMKSAIRSVAENSIAFQSNGWNYELRLAAKGGSCAQLENGNILLISNGSGKLEMDLGGGSRLVPAASAGSPSAASISEFSN